MLAVHSAYAAEITETSYDMENGSCIIRGVTDEAKVPVRIEILNNGYVFEDITVENIDDVYFYNGFAESGADNGFSFTLPVPENPSNYSVRISVFGGDTLTSSFATYDESDMNTEIEDYIKSSSRSSDKLKALISSYYGLLEVDFTKYESLGPEKQQSMFDQLEERIKASSSYDVTAFKNYLATFFLMEDINAAAASDISEMLKANAGVLEIDTKSVPYISWDAMANEAKLAIAEDIKAKQYKLNDLPEGFKNDVVMYELKNALWNEQITILTKYNDETKLSESNWSDVTSETNKKKILGEFKNKVTVGSITSLSQIKGVINDLVALYDTNKSYGGGSSGGSSKGSSGGGVNYTISGDTVVTKPQEAVAPFDDLASVEWAKIPIVALYNKGVVNGKAEREFNPMDTLTREELAVMVARGFNLGEVSGSVFADVAADRWSNGYIAAAKNAGLIFGVDENNFAPAATIKREDIAVILYRAAEKNVKSFDTSSAKEFTDKDKISDYAIEAVNTLYAAGVISGTGSSFEPERSATRAEAAKMIYEILKYCEIIK